MATIYVVEDDQNIREIESFSLKNSGYEVEDFECAAAFYKRMERALPDLILLDIMLPDKDGLEILKDLRARVETRRLPIIMVTAKTTEIDKVKGLDMGADDYLTKPFGVMELISRVKALMRRSSSPCCSINCGVQKKAAWAPLFSNTLSRLPAVSSWALRHK